MLLALKIVHVVFAAAWFGHKLLVPKDVRQSVLEREDPDGLVTRTARAERLGILSGVGTVLTGLLLIWMTTGFAAAPVRIYLGLAAALAMFVVGAFFARPAWREIAGGLDTGDVPRAAAGVRPFVGALHLESLLWVLALTTMLV